jgi:hypothetical protein
MNLNKRSQPKNDRKIDDGKMTRIFLSATSVVRWCSRALAAMTFATTLAASADQQPLTVPLAVPVPEAAALDTASRAIKDLLKGEIDAARTPPAKLDLAKSFLQKGIDTQGDPAGQYVLLRMARDSATALADASLAVQAIDEMARSFQIDSPAMKLETLSSIAKITMPPAQQKAFADTALAVADDAAAADNYDFAKQVAALGVAAAKKAREGDLVKQLLARDKEADALKLAFNEVKAAQDKLDEQPLDPAANLAVGRYRALLKADWDHGIPMLALGSDLKLKELATAELEADAELDATKRPDEQLKLADSWWDYAGSVEPATRDRIESRALFWYTKALPQLSGVPKLRVEKLLQEVSGRLFARIQAATRTKKLSRDRGAGSNRGTAFFDVLDEGGLLIGLEVGTVDVGGQRYIRSLRPLYRSARGETSGVLHGASGPGNTVTLKAKEGYAVGGITAKVSGRLDGLSITFMQTQGLTLNPRNAYSSAWAGSQAASTEFHLGGSGLPVVGVAGRLTNVIEAISLITLR